MISFVIPTLNEERVIEKTLQKLKEYSGSCEIIVSDGGSTDQTCEIARKYADKVIESSARQTIAGGRNAGAAVATGDYLVFIDADVEIPNINNFFSVALKDFKLHPDTVALTAWFKVFPEMATVADDIVFKVVGFGFMLMNNLLRVGNTGGEFMMVRASAFKDVGGFNEALVAGEDGNFFARLSKVGRTYFESDLSVYHTGRRAHKIGWPRLLSQWVGNGIGVALFKKSLSKEWTPIR